MKAAFYTIIGLQMLFLLGQTAMYQGRLGRGQTVYLKVVPYDPRSLFMGHYADLRYDISQVPVTRFTAEERKRLGHGATVYVVVTDDKPARLLRASLNKPSGTVGRTWLKGRIDYVGRDFRGVGAFPGDVVNLEYGLERYYVSENTGKRMDDLNQRLRDSKTPPAIVAVASVGKEGGAMLKDVLVDGKSVQ